MNKKQLLDLIADVPDDAQLYLAISDRGARPAEPVLPTSACLATIAHDAEQ